MSQRAHPFYAGDFNGAPLYYADVDSRLNRVAALSSDGDMDGLRRILSESVCSPLQVTVRNRVEAALRRLQKAAS
jgi:hypothetical protein